MCIRDSCTSNQHDCAGICDGSSVVDECGECGGGGIPVGDCDCNGNVNDCSGECGGSAVVDNCGTCDADASNDCVQDCGGVWGGDDTYTTYYLDTDSDGLGAGSANTYCSAFVPAGWVTNNDDSQPYCASNDTDECGF